MRALPKGIPEENFLSFAVYDNMTRSMLDTPQRYPRSGSQSYPSMAAEPEADGRRQARQLNPDRSEERLRYDPAPL